MPYTLNGFFSRNYVFSLLVNRHEVFYVSKFMVMCGIWMCSQVFMLHNFFQIKDIRVVLVFFIPSVLHFILVWQYFYYVVNVG